MFKTYKFKTLWTADIHSSKTANIILPGLMTLSVFGVGPKCRPLATKTWFRWYPTFDRMVHSPTY